MKQEVTTSEKNNLIDELSVDNSIERISAQKKSFAEYKEILNQATQDAIYTLYEMELSILTSSTISLDMGKQLKMSKIIISRCKKELSLPDTDEITFPEDFVDEYVSYLGRANKAIASVTSRIGRLGTMQGIEALLHVLEKNLLTLKMLRWHYVCALGLPQEDLYEIPQR